MLGGAPPYSKQKVNISDLVGESDPNLISGGSWRTLFSQDWDDGEALDVRKFCKCWLRFLSFHSHQTFIKN